MSWKSKLIDWLEQHRDYYHDGSTMSADASTFGEIAIKEVIEHVKQIEDAPTWTTDKPTKEGFYWHRPTGGGYAEVVRVFLDSFGRLQFKDTYFDEDSELLEEASGEWYGPLEVPE